MNFGDWQSSVAWLAMAVGRLDLASAVARRGRTREGGGSTRRGEGEHGSEEGARDRPNETKSAQCGFHLGFTVLETSPERFCGDETGFISLLLNFGLFWHSF